MEEFFESFVVPLQAAEQHAVVVCQSKEGSRDPTLGHRHAQLASPIVTDDAHAFKAQVFHKAVPVALDLQPITILPLGPQVMDTSLEENLPMVPDHDAIATPCHIT